ncbi:MAG: thiolase family protein [Micromonosporaceae bacterium]|nr:thiolase family protein [Micromonosporaceae bacterium]
MADKVFVVGVGMTAFGRSPDRSLRSLGREATLNALRDAGVGPRDVGVLVCGTARSGMLQGRESGVGQLVGWELGINQIPVYNVKNYCASGSTSFDVARLAVASGEHDVALAIGLEKLTARAGKGATLTSDGMEIEGDLGFSPPAYFGMLARRHMEQYGTTREQMAMVTVKNRRFSAHNPYTQYKDQVTVDEVLAAKPIAEPLTLLDCCPTTDGAAAAVLVSERVLDRLRVRARAVKVEASVLRTGIYEQLKDMTTFELDVRSSRLAYENAGIGPEDVDVAEVHDAFTIAEITHYEDLGLCAKGEGGQFVESGASDLGGKVAVSTSGGLLTRGHPLGATGLAQVHEIVMQLRGEAGERQVDGAKVGLTHVAGGFMENDIATSAVALLSR